MTLRSLLAPTIMALALAPGCKDTKPAPKATADATAATAARPADAAAAAVAKATPADAAARPADKAPALYFDRALTAADLEKRTLRELSLMRNTIFARAGHQFRKKWLRDYFTAQPWYQPRDEEGSISDLDRKNARAIAEREASVPKADLEARRKAIEARIDKGTASPEDRREIRLISKRLGKWVGSGKVAKADRSPLEDPTLLDKLLTVEKLRDLSRRDLRLLRNTIYARRGRTFKSHVLTVYFGDLDWYKPDPGYSDAKLTKVDWKNIRIVKSVENSLGGPLGEAEHAEWFFQA